MGSEIMTKEELQAAVNAVPYWYHRIGLPHDIVTPGWAPLNQSKYRIPVDLTGKTVLDVGAWDGYWTFRAIKRGAMAVTAIEDFSDTVGALTNADRSDGWRTFCLCARALGFSSKNACLKNELGQRIKFHNCDIQDRFQIDYFAGGGYFDHVFMFGVLYHLRHPLLALQNAKELMTSDSTIHIETAILDGCQSAYTGKGYASDDCCFEFFPGDEYGMNHSNWWVGTLKAWCGLVEAAGFKNIESWRLTDNPKHVSKARGFIRAGV